LTKSPVGKQSEPIGHWLTSTCAWSRSHEHR